MCEYFSGVLAGQTLNNLKPVTIKCSDGSIEIDEFIARLLVPYFRAYLDNTSNSRTIGVLATRFDIVLLLRYASASGCIGDKDVTSEDQFYHLVRLADFLNIDIIVTLSNVYSQKFPKSGKSIIAEFPVYFTSEHVFLLLCKIPGFHYGGILEYCKDEHIKLRGGKNFREVLANMLSDGFYIAQKSKYSYLNNLFSKEELRRLMKFDHLMSFTVQDVEDAIEKSLLKMKQNLLGSDAKGICKVKEEQPIEVPKRKGSIIIGDPKQPGCIIITEK